VRKIPEPLGRDALELLIDDFRLMIAPGLAEIFVLLLVEILFSCANFGCGRAQRGRAGVFVGFVVEEPRSRYSAVGFSGPATDYGLLATAPAKASMRIHSTYPAILPYIKAIFTGRMWMEKTGKLTVFSWQFSAG
jgi:hypothetical protein